MLKNLFLGIVTCWCIHCEICECLQKKIQSIASTLIVTRKLSSESMKDVIVRSETLLRKIQRNEQLDVSIKSFLPCYELILGKHVASIKQLWRNDESSKPSISYVLSLLKACMDTNSITIPELDSTCSSGENTAQAILGNEQCLNRIIDEIIRHQMHKEGYPNNSYWVPEYKRENWGLL